MVLHHQAELLKTKFGKAIAEEANPNEIVSIPGLRNRQPKEISIKNLAAIIQARMSEILAFVTFHLKQVGLDNKMLNGGIVLTGGGSQLKHLIQLTEYATGLNARIGYPNEHLAANHLLDLEKPMYATCIGLILKGYSVYENNQIRLDPDKNRIQVKPVSPIERESELPEPAEEDFKAVNGRRGRTINEFMNSIKHGLIDLFKEEGDKQL
jgi:cell division protein FtsA